VVELDLATCDQLLNQLEPAVLGHGDLRPDLAAVEFMDSSGMHALVKVSRELGNRGRLVLQSPTREAAQVLQVITHIFPNVLVDANGRPH
jgi:anti-anti-sigma factor